MLMINYYGIKLRRYSKGTIENRVNVNHSIVNFYNKYHSPLV